MKMFKFLALLFTFQLVSCVTPYQSKGWTGGFSETRLSENVFQVNFAGNGYTSRERVADFNLLRCADLTLENGYKYFIIVDSTLESSTSTYTTPSQSYTTGSAHSFGNHAYGSATTTTYGGETYTITKPTKSNTVVMYKEKPTDFAVVYDAWFICNSVGKKYGLMCVLNDNNQ